MKTCVSLYRTVLIYEKKTVLCYAELLCIMEACDFFLIYDDLYRIVMVYEEV